MPTEGFAKDALIIASGACNPRGVARALVKAIDEATINGSAGAKQCPAVKLILHQLCHLCGLSTGEDLLEYVAWKDRCREVAGPDYAEL